MTKVRINKFGELQLYRYSKFKRQICPYRKKWCGDDCPLFSTSMNADNPKSIFINLCTKSIKVFDSDFEDWRV